jgi:hypothetical protein
VTVAGEEMATTRITRELLTASVPDRLFKQAAALEVRVTNADEMRSNSVTLVVENGPLITRLSRKTIKAGAGEVEITIGGLSFRPEITLLVDGIPVLTLFVSETSLTARLSAEMTARPGTLTLQARNTDGGRSNKAQIRIVD